MKELWGEITSEPRHKVPMKLIPASEIYNHVGFMSTYLFPTETKDWIMSNYNPKFDVTGSMVGLIAAQLPIYSDILYVDFDVNPETDAKLLCADLREMNIGYSVWNTGGRSYHVHIKCNPKCDYRVPNSQRVWISGWAEARNAIVDYSIYKANALFRLPNTLHSKTGKPKVLLDKYEGTPLEYELIETTTKPSVAPANIKEGLTSLWRQILTPVEAGQRQFTVYKIASQGTELGLSESEITDICMFWNSKLIQPLTLEQITDKIFQST